MKHGLPFVSTVALLAVVSFITAAARQDLIKPDLPIVFTARATNASLQSALPKPSSSYPGTMLPRAIPGQLKLLKPTGELIDLTHRKRLPDGSFIVDVMSPAISLDGNKILFAGIRSAADHFHLYEINIDGSGLRQITGTPNDSGCSEPPFLLTRNGRPLTLQIRKSIDYDDFDPGYLPDGRIVFSSTRVPRRGLFDGRRVCNLWVMNSDGTSKHQITYGLGAERFPYVLKDGRILFSYWSRTLTRATEKELLTGSSDREILKQCSAQSYSVITGELPNTWWPASVNPDGTDFRALAKPFNSAVHVRPLFNGKLVFATQPDASMTALPYQTALIQILPGTVGQSAGGRTGVRQDFPQLGADYQLGPGTLTQGRFPYASLPAALPGGKVVYSAQPSANAMSLYVVDDDWAKPLNPSLLFEQPGVFCGEAQAVYGRTCLVRKDQNRTESGTLKLSGGGTYEGSIAGISSPDIFISATNEAPGQKTDAGDEPVFVPPPRDLIKSIELYAVNLERDKSGLCTDVPRLKLVTTATVDPNGGFHAIVPAGIPLMQIGRDAEGRLATWPSKARDRTGRSARLAAFAGDHFGYGTEGVQRAFCVGCHAGHTVLPGFSIADILKESTTGKEASNKQSFRTP